MRFSHRSPAEYTTVQKKCHWAAHTDLQWRSQTWADGGTTLKCLPWPIYGWSQLNFTAWTSLLIRTCTISLLLWFTLFFLLSIAIKCIVIYWTLWMYRTTGCCSYSLVILYVTVLARYFTYVRLNIYIVCSSNIICITLLPILLRKYLYQHLNVWLMLFKSLGFLIFLSP